MAAATTTFEKYLDLSTLIISEGGEGPERIYAAVTKPLGDFELGGFADIAAKKLRSTGIQTADSFILQSYTPAAPNGVGIIVVYVCIDISDIELWNEQGVSAVSEDRPDRTAFEASFDFDSEHSGGLLLATNSEWPGGGVC